MTSKHTPAPWKAVINGVGYWEVVHPWPEQSFAKRTQSVLAEYREEVARLEILQSELLEALQESLAALEWAVDQGGGPQCDHESGVVCFCKENNAINSARAAISKAIEQ